MAFDQKEYNQKYYRENKKKILADRKRKYDEDPDYRRRINRSAKKWRKKKDKKVARENRVIKRPRKPVEVEIVFGSSKMKVPAWTIGHLAKRLNRSKDSIYHWMKLGLFPDTPYKADRNVRLYTEGMINVAILALRKRGAIAADDTSFMDEVIQGWRGAGVPI